MNRDEALALARRGFSDPRGIEVRTRDALDWVADYDASARAVRRVERRASRERTRRICALLAWGFVFVMLALLTAQSARAADTVTWTIDNPCSSTAIVVSRSTAADAVAAYVQQWNAICGPNGYSMTGSASPESFANGQYASGFSYGGTFSGFIPMVGTCATTCQGPGAADPPPAASATGWGSTPILLQALIVVLLVGLLTAGIRTGMIR